MPDKVVQVPGLGNVSFPGTMSDDEIAGHIRDQISPPAQQPNPETFAQGAGRTLPIGGIGFGPMARIRDAVGATLSQLSSMKDAYDKAVDAHSKGRDFEALTHLVGVFPLAGTALHHAGETLGGTEAQYDKYGNIVKPGLKPDFPGAAGETLGLVAPSAIDVAAGTPKVVGTAATAVKQAVTAPGVGKIALGTGETLAGGAALAHGNLFGMYPLARGVKTIGKGLAERAAAKGAAADAEIEQFAPGFSKMSEKDQAITRMVYDRIKNGPPASSPPPPGKIAPLYNPPPEPVAQSASVAPTVPQAAPPAPTPPEAPPQANVAPPAAKAGPSAAEVAQTKARGLRAANAETLSQALSDAGKTAADVRPVRVGDWPKIAQQVGVDFPVTHSARLKLIRDTLARLQQREASK